MSQSTMARLTAKYQIDYFGEKTPIAYHFRGRRGGFYGLMRNYKNPHILFVVNARSGQVNGVELCGYSVFQEEAPWDLTGIR